MRYRHHKYTWSKPFSSVRHCWQLVGPKGGIHFTANVDEKYPTTCGLEIHYAAGHVPEYLSSDAPGDTNCWLIGGRCWHDGTSMYATESLWPMIESWLRIGDHEAIFRCLEREADERFGAPASEDEAA